MDPQACLKRITDAYKEGDQDEFDAALEDLIDWLKRGGFAPKALGPILGEDDLGNPHYSAFHSNWSCGIGVDWKRNAANPFDDDHLLWVVETYKDPRTIGPHWSLTAE